MTQDVAAPAQQVWDVLTDWDVHDRWMLLTHAEGGRAEGETVSAFTGVGRFGFLDTMTITLWDPPRRAVVRHTGKVVRGSGAFEVEAADPRAGAGRLVRVGRPAARGAGAARLAGGPAAAACGRPAVPAPPRPLRRGRRGRAAVTGTVVGEDGLARCPWGLSTPDYVAYHDDEWGRPVHGDARLFERVSLEAFQSGLSWITILRKREAFRAGLRRVRPDRRGGLR